MKFIKIFIFNFSILKFFKYIIYIFEANKIEFECYYNKLNKLIFLIYQFLYNLIK